MPKALPSLSSSSGSAERPVHVGKADYRPSPSSSDRHAARVLRICAIAAVVAVALAGWGIALVGSLGLFSNEPADPFPGVVVGVGGHPPTVADYDLSDIDNPAVLNQFYPADVEADREATASEFSDDTEGELIYFRRLARDVISVLADGDVRYLTPSEFLALSDRLTSPTDADDLELLRYSLVLSIWIREQLGIVE